MKFLTRSGVGVVLGVALGIALAEWFEVQSDTAYYAFVTLVALVTGVLIGALFGRGDGGDAG